MTVSGLTIYNWEKAESKPRKDALTKLIAVKDIGRREALRTLERLNDAKQVKGALLLKKAKNGKAKYKTLRLLRFCLLYRIPNLFCLAL